ncbi:ran-binding proteins 9/10 homolog isoform X2 [Rhizophagus clarus]|uniref:Ran-binding proteins 9/10 homolog isoform X2 n=1 Tax=Rhizophagus clarus TaxID=94130 RepID=A0A8H3LKI3_9GLOM|nr:ran-binding proteins 9/10 homolog isoform X2 [Rhizophagus clarus]
MDLPTIWNINDKSDRLSVDSDGLGVKYTGPLENHAAIIRTNHPIPPQCRMFYFEVDIVDEGKYEIIGIGFCTNKIILDSRMPGWDDESWGYHSDDGKFYNCNGYGDLYGPLFKTGDTIGCCLNFRNNTVFYTKNGMNLGIAFQDSKNIFQNLKGTLYPCIGMKSGSLKGNFGHKNFKYTAMTDDDIDEIIKEKWIEAINLYNDDLINDFIKSFKNNQNIINILTHQGKFYFIIGKYDQALESLTNLLKLEPNNTFALKYRGEIYYITEKYEESLADLNKLMEIDANNKWLLIAYNEIIKKQEM